MEHTPGPIQFIQKISCTIKDGLPKLRVSLTILIKIYIGNLENLNIHNQLHYERLQKCYFLIDVNILWGKN